MRLELPSPVRTSIENKFEFQSKSKLKIIVRCPSLAVVSARQYMQSALYAIARPTVRLSVRHKGGSVKSGWS